MENEFAQCVGKQGMEAERASRSARKKSFGSDEADQELAQLQADNKINTAGLMLEMKNTFTKVEGSMGGAIEALEAAKELSTQLPTAFQVAMGGLKPGSALLQRAADEEALESEHEEAADEHDEDVAVPTIRRQRSTAKQAGAGGGGNGNRTPEARRKELEKKQKEKRAQGLVGKQALSSSVRDGGGISQTDGAVASMVM